MRHRLASVACLFGSMIGLLCGLEIARAGLSPIRVADIEANSGIRALDPSNRLDVLMIRDAEPARLRKLLNRSDCAVVGKLIWKYGTKTKHYSIRISDVLYGSSPAKPDLQLVLIAGGSTHVELMANEWVFFVRHDSDKGTTNEHVKFVVDSSGNTLVLFEANTNNIQAVAGARKR